MTLTITTGDGETTLESVQSVTLLGPGRMSVACFGNDAVIWQGVTKFVIEPFSFPVFEGK